MLDSEELIHVGGGGSPPETEVEPPSGVTRLEGWLEAVDRVAPEAWVSASDPAKIPAHVRADSQFWCDRLFLPDTNPHDAPSVERAVRGGKGRAPDFLRHVYTAGGLDLTVIEGRNFLLVRVGRRSLDLMALREPERPAAVARAAAAIFREPLRFEHCTPIADGSLFCTDADVDPRLLASWAERAEGGIRGGELWFVCYKRTSQQVGFANPAQWFSDACITTPPRRAARGRARR